MEMSIRVELENVARAAQAQALAAPESISMGLKVALRRLDMAEKEYAASHKGIG